MSRRDSATLTSGAETVIDKMGSKLASASTGAHGTLRSSDENADESDANDSDDGEEAAQLPAITDPTSFRLTTACAEEDLRRWVVTLNESLQGPSKLPRAIGFVKDRRFTEKMLINALDLAIRQIRCEVEHVRSLVEYARRQPYKRHLRFDEDDFARYANVDAKTFARVKRRNVGVLLFEAAEDLDFLRTRAEVYSKRILVYKKDEAKDGDWAEIADLLRLGAVDEEWVDKHCVSV